MAREAIEPLAIATNHNPQDASTWNLLATVYIMLARYVDAQDCMERAVNLEGVDKHQDSAFFEDLREKLALLKEELRRQK